MRLIIWPLDLTGRISTIVAFYDEFRPYGSGGYAAGAKAA